MTYAEFILAAKAIHGDKYIYPDQEFLNKYTPIRIICKKHGDFYQRPNYHLTGGGCKKCAIEKDSKRKYLTQEKFIEKSRQKFPEYDYSQVVYKGTHEKVNIICPKHGIFSILASNLLAGHGCNKCYHRPSTKEAFIIAAKAIHGDKYDYSKAIYINNNTNIEIICSKHGSFWATPANHLVGKGCPKCNSSKGEKKIRHILQKLNIEFIEQKRFSDCRSKNPLPFDFYLPAYNLCIEYQGEQHYIPIKRGHQTLKEAKKALEYNKYKDQIKKDYCIKNNIKFLEISYKDNIKDKLLLFLKPTR